MKSPDAEHELGHEPCVPVDDAPEGPNRDPGAGGGVENPVRLSSQQGAHSPIDHATSRAPVGLPNDVQHLSQQASP